ncbi:MAG TPA: hypothetical protein VFR08_05410 [Candidatus Angelobacter sp.]|nr:hypothetical protein [Candidatus Angelobacter sp.]
MATPDTAKDDVTLPPGWQALETADGATELRVNSSGRGLLVKGALVLAAITAWRAVVAWNLPNSQRGFHVSVVLLLACFAIWCALADEYWHMGSGYLEHRIEFGPLRQVRRYQNATLEIVTGRDKYGKVFYRLHAVVDGKRSFMMERSRDELMSMERFIASRTGFRTL